MSILTIIVFSKLTRQIKWKRICCKAWQKNEFRKDEGLGEFAHACAKFCKRIKYLESIPKK